LIVCEFNHRLGARMDVLCHVQASCGWWKGGAAFPKAAETLNGDTVEVVKVRALLPGEVLNNDGRSMLARWTRCITQRVILLVGNLTRCTETRPVPADRQQEGGYGVVVASRWPDVFYAGLEQLLARLTPSCYGRIQDPEMVVRWIVRY